jgi:hypothetical protein
VILNLSAIAGLLSFILAATTAAAFVGSQVPPKGA